MNEAEKERLIKKDIESIENRVRHAFNQGYEMGMKESRSEIPNTCGDAISRQAVLNAMYELCDTGETLKENPWRDNPHIDGVVEAIEELPPVAPQQVGHCKECKYFEYDSVAKVDGIPLIVAHEICKKWGDGCKTKEDGYCFLFEPQESEG